MNTSLRTRLVKVVLRWEKRFGNAPAITSAISEYDAAMILGMTEAEYSSCMTGMTVVKRGYDFVQAGNRVQVKANRPSGKPGSKVTWVPKATNYDWDLLVWIRYDPCYDLVEAWRWDVDSYRASFHEKRRLSPADYRCGHRLVPR